MVFKIFRILKSGIQDVLNRDEASRLVSVLDQYPSIAKHIVRLLPKIYGKYLNKKLVDIYLYIILDIVKIKKN